MGRARKEKVGQILELALQDYESVKTLSYSIRNMSVEEQAKLKWQDILSEARTVNLEVDSLSAFKALGANMKTGEDVGRLIPGKGVFTKEQVFDTKEMVNEVLGTESAQAKDNFISVAYNEGQESSFANELGSDTFHQSNRNVATSRVANLLGIGGIVEQSSTVKVKEKSTGKITKGNLMTLAKGESGASIAQGKVYEEMKKKEDIKERIEEAGNKFAPTIQKELTSLQVLDYICGQTDRHANNFFVEYDKDTKMFTHIHGIDNDMSFGTGVDYGALVKKTGDYQWKKSMRMVVDAEGNLTLPHMDSQLAKNIFINSDSDWGMATHEELIRSTGDMKQMLPLVNEKGNEGYYQSAEYVFDKGKRYDTFRQNNYYGEFMLNVMGYHMGNRKFERD